MKAPDFSGVCVENLSSIMGGLGGDADIHILAEPHITVPEKSQSSLVVFYVNSTTLAGVLQVEGEKDKLPDVESRQL